MIAAIYARGVLCLSLLAGCSLVDATLRGGSTSYTWGRITSSHTNINGPRDWNRDAYECKRENTQLVTSATASVGR